MKKRMVIMLLSVSILFGAIFAYKLFEKIMIKRIFAGNLPVVTVSTTKVMPATWHSTLEAVGTTRAIQGIDVTTELAGIIDKIYFRPGQNVQANDILIQIRADADNALLQALQANAELGKITYERDKKQYAAHAVSKQILDSDYQNLLNLQALADQQAAIVAKKTIRAPFSGQLGIGIVSLGQYINPGDKIVSLQALDPIYVNFALPQQALASLKVGQKAMLETDAVPDKTFNGEITAIDPIVDINTRNVQVQATIPNPHHELLPGMYGLVTIDTQHPQRVLTLPQTAISFNPYGEMVFIVEKDPMPKTPKTDLIAKQIFVTTGETRGDQIQILKGLKEGQTVVSSGQLKLKNGMAVTINNSILLPDAAHPNLPNDHETSEDSGQKTEDR